MTRIWSAAELRAEGMTRGRISRAVRDGELVRIRRDNYCAPGGDPLVMEAVRIGGRLGCVSLLREAGVWVTESSGTHIHVAPDATRLRRGVAVVHWVAATAEGDRGRVALLDALLMAMLCQSFIDAVASVDSALLQGMVRLHELRPLCTDAARTTILQWVDRRAESGLETIVRVALLRAGLRVEVQVRIRGVGRVDLVVEGWVIVETDGRAYHAGARRHVDHQRDAAAAALGFTSLRFDPEQVLGDLPAIVEAVIAAVRSHRSTRFSGRKARACRNRARRAALTGETHARRFARARRVRGGRPAPRAIG